MRTHSVIHSSGRQPMHYATLLQARAAMVRAADPGSFVAVLDAADHDVLAADGARALALRVLSRAAAVACPEHGSEPNEPCTPGPTRLCPRRLESAGLVPYVNGTAQEGLPGLNHRPEPTRRVRRYSRVGGTQ